MVDSTGRYSYFFNSSNPVEIAKSRSTPAILLLNYQLKIVYHNKEAFEVFKNNPFLLDDPPGTDNSFNLPSKLLEHCNKFKEIMENQESLTNFLPLVIQSPEKKQCYCFRLVPATSSESQKTRKYDPYLVVLIEHITPPEKWIELFRLSKREKEVVELLFVGYSNKEIADQLYISEYTVEDHVKNLMKKMNVKNRLSIVLKFLESQSQHSL